MGTTQRTITEYGRPSELGDCLTDTAHGSSEKLALAECPLCLTDPTRERHHFAAYADRAAHFRAVHGPDDISGVDE